MEQRWKERSAQIVTSETIIMTPKERKLVDGWLKEKSELLKRCYQIVTEAGLPATGAVSVEGVIRELIQARVGVQQYLITTKYKTKKAHLWDDVNNDTACHRYSIVTQLDERHICMHCLSARKDQEIQ